MSQASAEFIPTRIAILTVSSRRGEEDDTSGHWLREAAQEAGHHVVDKAIVKENRYAIRAQVSAWIASDDVDNIIAPQLDARTRPCNFIPHLKK